jgi:hypothetical protein
VGSPPYLPVAPGKHGVEAALAGLDGHHLRLRGSLIEREELSMIEVLPETVHAGSTDRRASHSVSFGAAEFTGEIVDGMLSIRA